MDHCWKTIKEIGTAVVEVQESLEKRFPPVNRGPIRKVDPLQPAPIDPQSRGYGNYKFKGRKITRVSDGHGRLFGSLPFSRQRKETSIRIDKTLSGGIRIGAVDSNLKKSAISSSAPNAIWYDGKHKELYGDGKDTLWGGGKKFETGDTVTVSVDLQKGEIEWIINGASEYRYSM